jgi:hypothetical protein
MSDRDVQGWAQKYLDRGWNPIRVHEKDKKPVGEHWQQAHPTASEFQEHENIGVHLGNGLYDSDLDSPEARAMADDILPDTGCVFGRPSELRAHRLYYCREQIPTIKFNGIGGADDCLLELRGWNAGANTPSHTVFPPSLHRDTSPNEVIEWDMFGEPTLFEKRDQLWIPHRNLAACSLVARYFPGPGAGHDARMALAGFLYRAGVEENDVLVMGRAIMRYLKRDEQDWNTTARGTIQKLKADPTAKVTGGITLKEAFGIDGEKVMTCLNKILGRKEKYTRRVAVLRKLSEVDVETIDWLWEPYIPKSRVTLIEGDPGDGKSHLSLAIGSGVSLGKGLPNNPDTEPANVLLLNAEDGLGDTVRPRVDRMGGDVERMYALDGPVLFDGEGLEFLEQKIQETTAALVVIDPWVAYVGGKMNMDKANETREVLFALAEIAKRQRCAVVLIRHITKGGRDKAIYRGLGSIDITAACRSVLLVGKDASDATKRAMTHIKHNMSPKGQSIGYTIEKGQFLWTGVSTVTAEDILAPENSSGDKSKLEDANDVLEAMLANGPRPEKEIMKRMSDLDISTSTFRRAKRKLSVQSRPIKDKNGKVKSWEISLPSAKPLLSTP